MRCASTMPPKDRNFVPMGNKIIPVLDAPRVEQWLRLPWSIYSEDKNWIPHLLQDVAKVFDPTKNKLLKDGKAMRWVLEDEQGQVIGRIAAFVDPKTAHTEACLLYTSPSPRD